MNWFGVTAGATWLGASLIDLAPGIADAQARELDLLSFSEDASGHDWHYLLAPILASLHLFLPTAKLKKVDPGAATG